MFQKREDPRSLSGAPLLTEHDHSSSPPNEAPPGGAGRPKDRPVVPSPSNGFRRVETAERAAVLLTCGLFEPHEWKRNVCRNCFGTRVAHELPRQEDVRSSSHNAKDGRAGEHSTTGKAERRTIKVPHYETFENLLRQEKERGDEATALSRRSPRSRPVSVQLMSLGGHEPQPKLRSSLCSSTSPSPALDFHALQSSSSRPSTKTDTRSVGRGEEGTAARERGDAEESPQTEEERRSETESLLAQAHDKIAKLRSKLSRKNKELKEAENVRYTLRIRMDALLKEAAELEKAERQLRLEHAQAWEREKEFWIQEVETAKKETSFWRATAEQHRKALEQHPEENNMERTSVVRSNEMPLAEAPSPERPRLAEAATNNMERQSDEELQVKRCQRIVRSWLARKRCNRLVSLVRAYMASPLAKTQRRRFATIRELIQTERNYAEMIQHAVDYYMTNLREKAEFEAKTFYPEDIENLFNNIETLSVISQQFLQALEQRYATTDSFSCYGDIILKFQMVLPLYSVYYRKYEETNDLLQRLTENEEFTEYLEELQKNSSYNSLLALKVYLYRPCQRIPQYSLLLKQLLSYTPPDHVDYHNILNAAERVHKILDLLNRRTKCEQAKRKLQEIQTKLIGYDKNLTDDRMRQYLGEDEWLLLINVQRADPNPNTRKLSNIRGFKSFVWRPVSMHMHVDLRPDVASSPSNNVKAQKIHVFIISDVLLFVKVKKNGSYRYQFSIPLAGAVVTEMNGAVLLGVEFDNPLMIKPKSGVERFFLFKNQAERRKWTEKLWAMILVLNEEGKVKPEMRRRINRGKHMRLTHIGMTNLMKAAMGNESSEMPEIHDDLPNIYEFTSSPQTPLPLSAPPTEDHQSAGVDDVGRIPRTETQYRSETFLPLPDPPVPRVPSVTRENSAERPPSSEGREEADVAPAHKTEPPAIHSATAVENQANSVGPESESPLTKDARSPTWSPVQPRRSGSQFLTLRRAQSIRDSKSIVPPSGQSSQPTTAGVESTATTDTTTDTRPDPVDTEVLKMPLAVSDSAIALAQVAGALSSQLPLPNQHWLPDDSRDNGSVQTDSQPNTKEQEPQSAPHPEPSKRFTNDAKSESDSEPSDEASTTTQSGELNREKARIRKQRRKLKREIKKLELMRQRDEDEREQRQRRDREHRERKQRKTERKKLERAASARNVISERESGSSRQLRSRPVRQHSARHLSNSSDSSSSSDDDNIFDLNEFKKGSKHYHTMWSDVNEPQHDLRKKPLPSLSSLSPSIRFGESGEFETKHSHRKDAKKASASERSSESSRSHDKSGDSKRNLRAGSNNSQNRSKGDSPSYGKVRTKRKEPDRTHPTSSQESDRGARERRREPNVTITAGESPPKNVFESPLFVGGIQRVPSTRSLLTVNTSPALPLSDGGHSTTVRKRSRSNSFDEASLVRALQLDEAVPNSSTHTSKSSQTPSKRDRSPVTRSVSTRDFGNKERRKLKETISSSRLKESEGKEHDHTTTRSSDRRPVLGTGARKGCHDVSSVTPRRRMPSEL